jgi:replicative DNA helicase
MSAQKIDLETAVLACVCSDRYVLTRAIDEGLRPELFRAPAAQVLATALLHVYGQNKSGIDVVVLQTYLEEHGLLTPQTSSLLESMRGAPVVSMDRFMSYLELLKERHARAQLIQLASSIDSYARQGQRGQLSIVEFTGQALQELLEIQRQRLRKRLRPVGDSVRQLVTEAEQLAAGEKALLGYSLAPFILLNEVLSGLRPGFYYGLAGAPRRGKTNFALQLAASTAANAHIPVLFYSWEQTRRVLSARLLGKEAGLNPVSLLTNNLTTLSSGVEKLAKGLGSIQRYGRELFLVEGGRQDTVDHIRASAYNLMHEFRTDSIAIFIDYLQKVPLPKVPADARTRIDEISTALADLSLELACPVFAISSIDKEGCRLDDEPDEDRFQETLNQSRPTMHNCTGGGDIEYDMDVVMILAKDWKASKELEELLKSKTSSEAVPKIDILDLHIDKNRDAPAEAGQSIQYAFFVHENRFVELDYKSDQEYKAEFRGFARVQEIFSFLVEKGHLQPVRTSVSSDRSA